MELINMRRSIRSYLDKPVEEEKIELLLRAAMQAPSAMNQQPWRITVIEDRELLDELAEGLLYGKMLAQAPLAFLMVADTEDLRSPKRWPQDMAAATQNVMLRATELGLGSVWVSLYPDDLREGHVRGLFDIQEPLVPFCIIALGYSDKDPWYEDRFDEKKVRRR